MIQERIPEQVSLYQIMYKDNRIVPVLNAVLHACGVKEQDIVLDQDQQTGSIKIYGLPGPKRIILNKIFGRVKINGVKVSVRVLRPKDWATLWKTQWKPGALTRQIDVVPVWHKKQYVLKHGKKVIYLDTLLSFGTGLHETTQMMAQYIEDHAQPAMRFLDIGTGTGILSLVAFQHGVKDILALDIGDLSVGAALNNFALNKLNAPVKQADIFSWKQNKQYDLIAANLVTLDLIKLKDKLTRLLRPGGLLAVSGISKEHESLFKKKFVSSKLMLRQTKGGGTWKAFLFEKKMS